MSSLTGSSTDAFPRAPALCLRHPCVQRASEIVAVECRGGGDGREHERGTRRGGQGQAARHERQRGRVASHASALHLCPPCARGVSGLVAVEFRRCGVGRGRERGTRRVQREWRRSSTTRWCRVSPLSTLVSLSVVAASSSARSCGVQRAKGGMGRRTGSDAMAVARRTAGASSRG